MICHWNNSDEIEMQNLPAIDWANVNWLYVAVLAVFVFFPDVDRNAAVLQTGGSQCFAVGLVVCGGLCVLELLSARLAAADNDHHPEWAGRGRHR